MMVKRQESAAGVEAAAFGVKGCGVYLGVSPATVWRLLKSGELRRTRIGGRTVILRSDADALLARSAGRVA